MSEKARKGLSAKERKERERKKADAAYAAEFQKVAETLVALRTRADGNTLYDCVRSLQGMASFLLTKGNEIYRKPFLTALKNNPRISDARVLLRTVFLDTDTIEKLFLKNASYMPGVFQSTTKELELLMSFGHELRKIEGVSDPFRSGHAIEHTQATSQTLEETGRLLFPEFSSSEEFLSFLREQKEGVWLDVGSGQNYERPESLMNRLARINSNLRIVGADLLYAPGTAAVIDRVLGLADIKKEAAAAHELISVGAQNLSSAVGSETFDGYLSSLTYDKFNEDNGGVAQALREAAHVLKPGAFARIIPFTSPTPEIVAVIEKYFSIKQTYTVAQVERPEVSLSGIVLEKKELTDEEKAVLRAEIDRWHKTYLPEK